MTNRLAVSLHFLVNGFVFANWAATLPQLQERYGIDHRQIGMVLLAHSIGAFLAMPVTGAIISRKSSRWVTKWSGILSPIVVVTVPFMTGYYSLLVPFFFMGIVVGAMDVAMNAQAVEVERVMKKPIMTTFHAVFSIGMMLGGLFASIMSWLEMDIVFHYGLFCSLSVLCLMWASQYLFPDQVDAFKKQPLFVRPRGIIVGLGIIAFCCMVGEGAMADWSANYMKRIVNAPPYLHAAGLTAFAAFMTLGRLLGDKGRANYGDGIIMVSGSVIALIGMALVLALIHPIVVVLGFGLVGLGLSNIVPIVYSLSGSVPGISAGTGIAMATTIGYGGFMLGPPAIGFVAELSSLRWSLAMMGGMFVLMLILVLRYQRQLKNSLVVES